MKTDLWKCHSALFFVSVTCLLLVSMFLFLLHALLISTHLMYSLKHKLLKPTSLWFISFSCCRQIGVPLVPAKKVTLQVVLFRKLLYSKTKRCNHDRLLNRCLMSSKFSNDFCMCVFSGKVSVFLQLFEDIQLRHFRLRWAGADRLCLHEVEGNVCCLLNLFHDTIHAVTLNQVNGIYVDLRLHTTLPLPSLPQLHMMSHKFSISWKSIIRMTPIWARIRDFFFF